MNLVRAEVLAIHWDGNSIEEICEHFTTRRTNVVRILRLSGVEITTCKSPLSNDDKAAVVALYTPELGVSKTAKRLGLSRAKVDKFLKANGFRVISNNESRAIPATDRAKIEAMYWEDGWTAEEIGREYGIQSCVVMAYLRREGIPTRSQAESVVFLGRRLESEIVGKYVAGASQISIAKAYELNDHQVRNLLKRHGVYKKVPAPPKLNDITREDARRLYVDEGWTMDAVRSVINANKADLSAFLSSIRISRIDRKYTPELRAEICERYCAVGKVWSRF